MGDEIKVKELTDEEAERALSDDPELAATAAAEALAETLEDAAVDPDAGDAEGPPDWAAMPADVKLPPPGMKVAYLRIPAAMTANPFYGDLWCACWPISETEEIIAHARSRGNPQRAISEMAKQTIRVVNGNKADWSGKKPAASVARFWAMIGPKGRQLVRNYYMRTHMVTDEEGALFFGQHFVTVTVSAG